MVGRSSGRFQRQAASQLDGGLDLGGFGFADAMLFFQLRERRAVQSAQPAKFLEQALSHADGVLTLHAHAHEDGDQLGVAERLRSQRGQPLARRSDSCRSVMR